MYQNYEKRVKEFITDMTNPSSQIVINDITEKINNCRQELMNEDKLQKPFIFKGYTSELDRINDTVKNNRLLYNLPDYPDTKQKKSPEKDTINDISFSTPKINFHILEDLKKRDREREKENEIEKNKSIESTPNKQDSQILTLNTTRGRENQDPNKKTFKRRMSLTEKNQIKDLIKKDSILQPQMRFTARTDLERVYDVLNGDYMKNQDRDIIERQLRNVNLFNYKRPKELLKSTDNAKNKKSEKEQHENSPEKEKKLDIKIIYGPSKIYYEPKNNDKKSWARKDNLNAEARGLLSSYHFKTHFKATEEIAEYKTKNNKKLKETCFLLPHLLPKNHRYQYFYTDADIRNLNKVGYKSVKSKRLIDYSKLDDTRDLFKFEEEHEKDVKSDKIAEEEYNGVNNPILKGNKLDIDPDSLKILSKLAFNSKLNENVEQNLNENNDSNSANNGREKEYERNKNEETGIKLSNLNKIAKKVLNECNVYSNKSKFNNSSHKSKGGKTMITKGMTIKEFESKFKFNN